MKTPEEYELRMIEKNLQKQKELQALEEKHGITGTPEEKIEQVNEKIEEVKEEEVKSDYERTTDNPDKFI